MAVTARVRMYLAASEAVDFVTWHQCRDLPVCNAVESQDKFPSKDNEFPLLVFFLGNTSLFIHAIFNVIGPAGLMHC